MRISSFVEADLTLHDRKCFFGDKHSSLFGLGVPRYERFFMLSRAMNNLGRCPFCGSQEALRGLLYRKAGMHDGKMRKDILYADFVLRESARQASVAGRVQRKRESRSKLSVAGVEALVLYVRTQESNLVLPLRVE